MGSSAFLPDASSWLSSRCTDGAMLFEPMRENAQLEPRWARSVVQTIRKGRSSSICLDRCCGPVRRFDRIATYKQAPD